MIEKRSVGLAILFTILTCGIYGLYWLVKITDEANSLSGEQETSGGMVLLLTLVICGIYGYFWSYYILVIMLIIAIGYGVLRNTSLFSFLAPSIV